MGKLLDQLVEKLFRIYRSTSICIRYALFERPIQLGQLRFTCKHELDTRPQHGIAGGINAPFHEIAHRVFELLPEIHVSVHGGIVGPNALAFNRSR